IVIAALRQPTFESGFFSRLSAGFSPPLFRFLSCAPGSLRLSPFGLRLSTSSFPQLKTFLEQRDVRDSRLWKKEHELSSYCEEVAAADLQGPSWAGARHRDPGQRHQQ